MNYPLDHAICRVCRSIPPQILDLAIRWSNKKFHENNNLTEFICDKIVNSIVLKDVNLVAGQIKTIVLKPTWIESMVGEHGGYAGDDGPNTIYRIPPEARDGKPISQVMSVQFPYITYQSSGIANADVASGGYSLVDQIDNVIASYTLSTPRNHPTAYLLSGDLIRLVPSQYTRQHWLLTCRINYDETFNNMAESNMLVLSKLVEAATKRWLWVNLVVDIDRACQECGVDIGTIKSLVDEYKDADQQYEEQFLLFRGSANLDPETRRRLLFFQL